MVAVMNALIVVVFTPLVTVVIVVRATRFAMTVVALAAFFAVVIPFREIKFVRVGIIPIVLSKFVYRGLEGISRRELRARLFRASRGSGREEMEG